MAEESAILQEFEFTHPTGRGCSCSTGARQGDSRDGREGIRREGTNGQPERAARDQPSPQPDARHAQSAPATIQAATDACAVRAVEETACGLIGGDRHYIERCFRPTWRHTRPPHAGLASRPTDRPPAGRVCQSTWPHDHGKLTASLPLVRRTRASGGLAQTRPQVARADAQNRVRIRFAARLRPRPASMTRTRSRKCRMSVESS